MASNSGGKTGAFRQKIESVRKAMKQEGIKFTDLIRILTKEELLVGAGH